MWFAENVCIAEMWMLHYVSHIFSVFNDTIPLFYYYYYIIINNNNIIIIIIIIIILIIVNIEYDTEWMNEWCFY